MRELVIDQQEIQMAQYIPHHHTCGVLHGHTYVIKNISVFVIDTAFIDFGDIKQKIKEWDHRQFFPIADKEYWEKAIDALRGSGVRFNPIWLKETTVEYISDYLLHWLRDLSEPEIVGIRFTITEGLHQGVTKTWGRVK